MILQDLIFQGLTLEVTLKARIYLSLELICCSLSAGKKVTSIPTTIKQRSIYGGGVLMTQNIYSSLQYRMTISQFFVQPSRFQFFQLSLPLLLFSFLMVPPCQAELVDRVVAVVNNAVITMSEVDEEGKLYFRKVTETASSENLTEMLAKARADVLGGLIDKYLIKQKARELRIAVSDSEVTTAIEKIMVKNNLSPEEFKARLKERGINEQTYKDNLKSQILQKKLISYAIHSKIVITDDMILDYYDTHYTKHLQEDEYYLLQMGFLWGQDQETRKSTPALYLDKQEARKRAERVHALALQGRDFRELAGKFSELPSAEDGGDIGTFNKKDMADYMRKTVISLSQGEISDIIETPAGFQFFKLLSGKDTSIVTSAPFESAKKEIQKKLYQEKLQGAFAAWITTIRQKAYIQKM